MLQKPNGARASRTRTLRHMEVVVRVGELRSTRSVAWARARPPTAGMLLGLSSSRSSATRASTRERRPLGPRAVTTRRVERGAGPILPVTADSPSKPKVPTSCPGLASL